MIITPRPPLVLKKRFGFVGLGRITLITYFFSQRPEVKGLAQNLGAGGGGHLTGPASAVKAKHGHLAVGINHTQGPAEQVPGNQAGHGQASAHAPDRAHYKARGQAPRNSRQYGQHNARASQQRQAEVLLFARRARGQGKALHDHGGSQAKRPVKTLETRQAASQKCGGRRLLAAKQTRGGKNRPAPGGSPRKRPRLTQAISTRSSGPAP